MPPGRSGWAVSRERRSNRRLAFWWVATLVLPLAFWWLMRSLDTTTLTTATASLLEAEFLATPGAAPPVTAAGWERRPIPDDWRVSAPGALEGWYRLSFHAGDSAIDDWAVYLPVVHTNAAVWVNGQFVGDGGRFEEPLARNRNRPLLFAVPASLVVAGRNTLHLRLKADRVGTGVLGPVHVGPKQALRPVYARRHLFAVELLRAIAVGQVVVTLFIAVLWLQRREETPYMWAALGGCAWILTWPFILVVETPVATRAWYWLWYAAAGWFTLLASRFVLDLIGESSRRVNRWILGWGSTGSVALAGLAVVDSSWFHAFAIWVWIPLSFLAPTYSTFRFLKTLGRNPGDLELGGNYVVGISIFGCGMHDWMVLAGLLPALESFYSPYPAPLSQLAIGVILVRRFAGALGESEAQVESLEEKVRQKRAELQQGYERIRETDRSRVLSDERQRIMRDVQDGLGSHLVSTLALTERTDADRHAIANAVHTALDDLRLMIDSLGPVEGEILPVLGQLRVRLQPRLDAAGIRVEWRVEDVALVPDLGPHRVLQILRILNEAIGEILGHPGARTITVRTGDATAPEGRAAVFVEVGGDGSGRVTPGERMRRRAREIGALLETESSPGKSRYRLWLPLVESEDR